MLQASVTEAALPAVKANPLLTLNLAKARNASLFGVTLAVLLQLALFFSIDNLIASGLLVCGAFIGIYYAVNRKLLNDYPLSTLAIIGYTVSYFVIPPLGKLVDFQSIVQGLDHPILVWVYGLTGLLALTIAHYVYRTFSPYWTIRWSLTRGFYRPLHFFEMPDNAQFWLLGIVGIGATLATVRFSPVGGTSVWSSVVRDLSPLIYVPYLAAYPNLIDPRYTSRRRPFRLGLIVYSALLLAVSAMVNSRGLMLTGFASLALVYSYRVITGTISLPRFALRSFTAVAVCLWLISGPMTNLATSMLIARRVRGTLSPWVLAETTWEVYRNGTAVRIYEESVNRAFRVGSYNEVYYNNIFLNRLANMRFTDLSINAAHGVMALGDTSYFRRSERDRIIAVLPAPLIQALHLGIDKKKAISGSSEDFLYELATRSPVGGFKSGSPLVILRMTFGIMWPLYFGLISTVVFSFLDARSDLVGICDGTGDNRICNRVVFNPIVAGTLFTYVFYFTPGGPENVASYIAWVTREWISIGLMYAAAFVLTKWASSLMFGWVWRGDMSQHGV